MSIASLVIEEIGLFVESSDHQIENGNDVCGVALELSVESLIELVDVIAINIQNIILSVVDLLEKGHIVRFFGEVFFIISHINESRQELSQLLLHLS